MLKRIGWSRPGLVLLLDVFLILVTLTGWRPPVVAGRVTALDNPVWRIGGNLEALDIEGDYAYLAQGTYLRVIYLPTRQEVAALPFRYPVRDVAADGRYVYVVTNTYGDLHVVDAQDPASPQIAGTGQVPGWSGGDSLVVRGDYVYVLDELGGDGLITFDVTNPASPTFVAQVTGYYGRWLRPGADHLYALRYNGLFVFDLATPNDPQKIGEFDCTSAQNLAVVEPYIYVTDLTSDETGTGLGVVVVDVSNPAQPGQADTWIYYGEHTGNTAGVAVAGIYAYVGYNDNGGLYSALYVLDISTPNGVRYVDRVQPVASFYNFTIQSDTLYVAGGPDGDLIPLSLADPTQPVVVGRLSQPGRTEHLQLDGQRLYALARGDYYGAHDSLWVYDVADPLAPAVVHHEDPHLANLFDLAVAGDYVYLCGSRYGLQILNAADLSERGHYIPAGADFYCTDVTVQGGLAYVLHPGTGALSDDIGIIDVSNPDAPLHLNSLATTGDDLRQIVADGQRLYTVDYDQQVLLYDLAAPSNPTLITGHALPGLTTLYPAGGRLYAGTQSGLTILDVQDPQNIQSLGSFPTLNAVQSIDVVDHVAYLGCANQTYAVDVSNPTAPGPLWEHDGPAEGLAIQAQPPLLWVADGELGLTLYATGDGAVRPDTGNPATVFADSALQVTFAQDMDTASVQFTCVPDPGRWQASWSTHATSGAPASGRVLMLRHSPFAENQSYSFQITQGTTAAGTQIDPFGLDFFVVETHHVYLPLLQR